MNTDDLVKMLATTVTAVDPRMAVRRYAAALVLGVAAAALLMVAQMGVRADLAQDIAAPMFWMKLAFTVAVSVAAMVAVWRLGHPGASLARVGAAVAAPILLIWVLAAVALVGVEPEQRSTLVLGRTAGVCPFNIALLSAPVLVVALWALRGLAPTRLRWAGAAAGLLAGGTGAAVYTFHCPELAAPFLGTWYVLGMLIPAALGALVGPRVLRW